MGPARWQVRSWCIAKVTADFVWRMEHVLSVYARPYNPLHPVVCFDEKPYQLLSHVQPVQPAKPGVVRREDYEYRREGTLNLFVAFEPLTGQRVIEVTNQRCAQDFADQMRKLAARYPDAQKIHVVLDNLSTHSPSALYQAMPPAEAQALLDRLEFHFTPKHGSWLNMRAGPIRVPFCPRRLRLSGRCLNGSVWGSEFRARTSWRRLQQAGLVIGMIGRSG